MKKIMTLAFAAAAGLLVAAPAQNITGQNKYEMTVHGPPQYIELVDGGRSGKCFRLAVPADSKNRRWFTSRIQTKVESASDKVKVTIRLKGKGSGTFGFLCYDINRKNIYPRTTEKYSIDSSEWKKFEFEFTPRPGKLYADKIGYVLPGVELAPGSEIFADDMTLEFINPNKNIQIEE